MKNHDRHEVRLGEYQMLSEKTQVILKIKRNYDTIEPRVASITI